MYFRFPSQYPYLDAGLSSLGVPGVPWHPQILADQLTLSQQRGADYAHQIILAPGFSDLPMGLLVSVFNIICKPPMEIQNFKSTMVLQPGIGHIFVIKVGKLEIQQRKLTLALHD